MHWAEINYPHFGDLEVDQMDLRSVDARVDVYALNTLQLYMIGAPAHRVRSRPIYRYSRTPVRASGRVSCG